MRFLPHRSKFTTLVAGSLCITAASAMPLLGGKSPGSAPAMPEGFAPPGRMEPEPSARHSSPGLSARQAATQAQALNGGGRVLSVEEATDGWRVKLLKDGTVRFVFVPH